MHLTIPPTFLESYIDLYHPAFLCINS